MNEQFVIDTQKTQETLKDFILFKRRATRSHTTFHLCIIAGGLISMGLSAKAQNPTATVNFLLIGIFILLFAFFRHYFTLSKFKKSDQAFLEKWKLTYLFTDNTLFVYRNGELFEKTKNYHSISSLYVDEKNFYLGINNEDLYVLPKQDFKLGTSENFVHFITSKSNIDVVYLPAKLQNQIKLLIKR